MNVQPSDGGWFFLSSARRIDRGFFCQPGCPVNREAVFFCRKKRRMKMQVQLNGKFVELDAGVTTVSKLLHAYGLQEKIVVVERNGEIVDRSAYEEMPIADGDRIEIVHFVGGG
jgi:sulfur carrier protein